MDLNVCPACGAWSDDFARGRGGGADLPGVRPPAAVRPAAAVRADRGKRRWYATTPSWRPRLRARPPWRAWTDEKVAHMLAFNRWVQRNAATTTPPMELLDTSGHSVHDSAAGVRAWVLRRLDRSR